MGAHPHEAPPWRPASHNWLLIKEHDEYERAETDPAITDEAPNSAVTGRSIEEIARAETHVWNSKDTATGKAWFRNEQSGSDKGAPSPAKAARKQLAATQNRLRLCTRPHPQRTSPRLHPPQLATQATEAPRSTGWVHELKLDGYRIQARKDSDRRPAPHPHRPRLDAPHEVSRRRTRRALPAEYRHPRRRSRRPLRPAAAPASPTCRPHFKRAQSIPSPTSLSTSSTSTDTTCAT